MNSFLILSMLRSGTERVVRLDEALTAIEAERDECAAECERMMMFPGGRQESFAHHGVQAAAKAIRERSNAELTGGFAAKEK